MHHNVCINFLNALIARNFKGVALDLTQEKRRSLEAELEQFTMLD